MVQEFHILRCFSCKTFQVQQVKKSKKWNCKVCGEKQSLIKEYGRGTAADCRRHVQKLNSLRGELLEVENERAWTQWEKEEESEVEDGDDTQGCEQKGQVVSRWGKYVTPKENEPGCDDDDEHEENVYTDREWCTQRNNIRKRKKIFTSAGACRRYNVGDEENLDTAHWEATGLLSQSSHHNGTFTSPQVPCSSAGFPRSSTNQRTDVLSDSPAATMGSKHINAYNAICSRSSGSNKQQASAESSTKLQQAPGSLSGSFTPSFSPQHPSKSKPDTKNSKWARFLPLVCVEEIEDEGDGGEQAQFEDVEHSALDPSPTKAVPLRKTGSTRSGEALLDKEFGVEKVTVFEKLSHCTKGNVCKQINSPTITSKPVGFQSPVCVQPLPMKRPCPDLSFSTLFHTEEDFDDAY